MLSRNERKTKSSPPPPQHQLLRLTFHLRGTRRALKKSLDPIRKAKWMRPRLKAPHLDPLQAQARPPPRVDQTSGSGVVSSYNVVV